MTTMTEEMGTALIEGVVKCPQTEEAMVVEGRQVHIVGVEVALTMGMELSQVLDMRLEEVLSMVELKALSMKDIIGKCGIPLLCVIHFSILKNSSNLCLSNSSFLFKCSRSSPPRERSRS